MYKLLLGTALVLASIAFTAQEDFFQLFLNLHAISIVFGGTVAILIASTPKKSVRKIFKLLIELANDKTNSATLRSELTELTKRRKLSTPSTNVLINYAASLWDDGVEPSLINSLLDQKRIEIIDEYHNTVAVLKNLAKYPPALGMTGTVVGLVSMFSKLNESGTENIGFALALALTATFYGLFLSNCFILPFADHCQIYTKQREQQLDQVYQTLAMINADIAGSIIEKEVSNRAA